MMVSVGGNHGKHKIIEKQYNVCSRYYLYLVVILYLIMNIVILRPVKVFILKTIIIISIHNN